MESETHICTSALGDLTVIFLRDLVPLFTPCGGGNEKQLTQARVFKYWVPVGGTALGGSGHVVLLDVAFESI